MTPIIYVEVQLESGIASHLRSDLIEEVRGVDRGNCKVFMASGREVEIADSRHEFMARLKAVCEEAFR